MKELELKTEYRPDGEVQAWVEHNGERIDQHYHSSEGWLLSDWEFCGSPNGSHFSHAKTITEKLGTEDWKLTYKAIDGKVFTLTPVNSPNQ